MFPYTGELLTGSMPVIKEEFECLRNRLEEKGILSLWRVPHAVNHVRLISISEFVICQVVSFAFLYSKPNFLSVFTGHNGKSQRLGPIALFRYAMSAAMMQACKKQDVI